MYLSRNWILFLFFFLLHSVLIAQQRRVGGTVRGKSADFQTARILPYASVMVVEKADSSFVAGGASGADGHFNVRYTVKKDRQYLLRVSYMGYVTAFCPVRDSASVFNAGNIVLQNKGIKLREVTIKAKEPEVKMVGDTTIINASAYKLYEGAYLQDLVRRVPGLEYDEKSHSLTYNGMPVYDINVNGEDFFPGNISIPLENLPADFIGSIKVYDKRTDAELASGMDDGNEHYVLDLNPKSKFDKTYFASVKAGYGNNRKRANEAQFNYFRKGGENFSVFVRSDNKNQNSTYKNNIANSAAMNLSHKFSNQFALTGSIQYNHNRSGNSTTFYREQYLSASNQYTSSANEGTQKKRMASANWRLTWKADKRTQIDFTARSGLTRNNNKENNEGATFSASPGLDIKDPFAAVDTLVDSIKINRISRLSQNSSHSSNYACSASLVRKLNKKGSNISFFVQNNGRWSRKNNLTESSTSYFQLDSAAGRDSVLSRNQLLHSPAQTGIFNIGTAFTHPLSKKARLQFSYKYTVKNEDDNSDTYDLSSGKKQYVDSLNNRSHSRYRIHNIGVLFYYSDKVWRVNAGMSVAPGCREIERKVGTLCADSLLNIAGWSPMLRIAWKNKKHCRIRFSYNGNTRHPSLSQLVPLTDNSNPLKITRGNPGLKDAFIHSLRFEVQNPRKGIFASLGWKAEQNSIMQVTSYNEQTGGRETYPENVDGNWRMNVRGRWQKSFGDFCIMLNALGNYANRVSLLSESGATVPQRSVTRNSSVKNHISISYQPLWGIIDFNAGNHFRHSLNSLKDNSTYTRNYDFGIEVYANLHSSMQFRTDIAYSFRNGTNLQNSDNNEVMWNFGVSRRFMAGKKAELSLYWADILCQRKAYDRNADSNGFYESYTRQKRGYVMLSLKYNFRQIE